MIFIATLLICGSWYLLNLHKSGTTFSPSPNSEKQVDSDGFPVIDWLYWKSVNEDVVGWVTVPNTQIDYPIVQARKSNPRYYLTHDVYKNWNYTGSIYLDSECEDKGIEQSENVVIFGHNMGLGDNTLFEPFASYNNFDFAKEHERILIQTPNMKLVLSTFGVENINGNNAIKQTSFDSVDALQQYITDRYNDCNVKLIEKPYMQSQLFTFCTCSYNFNPSNERTLVYAVKKARI